MSFLFIIYHASNDGGDGCTSSKQHTVNQLLFACEKFLRGLQEPRTNICHTVVRNKKGLVAKISRRKPRIKVGLQKVKALRRYRTLVT